MLYIYIYICILNKLVIPFLPWNPIKFQGNLWNHHQITIQITTQPNEIHEISLNSMVHQSLLLPDRQGTDEFWGTRWRSARGAQRGCWSWVKNELVHDVNPSIVYIYIFIYLHRTLLDTVRQQKFTQQLIFPNVVEWRLTKNHGGYNQKWWMHNMAYQWIIDGHWNNAGLTQCHEPSPSDHHFESFFMIVVNHPQMLVI